MPYIKRLAAIAMATLVLAGCGIASGDERITIEVLAASSLTDAFAELGTAYQAAHKNVTVRFEFAGSQELAADVENREPADVLATADGTSMDGVAQMIADRRPFARNSMTIAVTPGNPERIRGLADLADPRLRVVLGGPTAPVGRYAAQVLAKAGVAVTPKSEEADSRTVLTRIRTGVADAGLVYVTDMRSAGVSASSVPIPLQQNVTATYFAAAVRRSGQGAAAKAFVTWLNSPMARTILQKYGFPPA
ncbi:MAG: molybdenum transporter, periplasmic molybdate-binding protein [Actinoallomurus sp.]|nr:molybdenum transporter, periplasmic molybdate-binding protein [Actinoallomurus sp.]